MDLRRSQIGQEPPGGEYVVYHERPYPKRLDRAFRVGAIVVAVPFLVIAIAVTAYGLVRGIPFVDAWPPIALGVIVAALAYAFTRAIGMLAVSIVGGLRRKAYVVDWEERPPHR